MACAACSGKGFVDDGSSHGAACLDCMDPVARRFLDAPVKRRKGWSPDRYWTVGKGSYARGFRVKAKSIRHTRGGK